jgi:hypothetical protein
VDPALAEWAGSGRFSARIYPLPPQSYKRIVFAYDQTLVPADGQIIYALPSLVPDIRNSRMTVYDVSMGIGQRTLQFGKKELAPTRSISGYAWTIQPADPGADTAGEGLYRSILRNPMVSALVGRDADVPGALVSLQVSPELPPQPAKEKTGRALFLLDTSYSSRNLYRDVSGQLLRHILETDDSLGEFAVLCFDVQPTLLTPGFVPNTEESREHYLALIQQIWLEGATNFEGALEFLQAQEELQGADTCFLLSDGQITWGRESPAELSSRFPTLSGMRWICYAFGAAPHNRPLFDALTRKSGRVVHAAAGQDLRQTAKAHRLPTYRLQGVFTMLQDEVIIAGDPQLLYPGQVLDIAVRIRQNTPSLRLVLTIDGRNHEIGIPLQESAAASYLAARTWAEVYVGRLMAGAAGPPDDTAVQAIFALSKHFALANDYASFIILETDEEYEQYAVFRRKLDFRAVQELIRQSGAAAEGKPRLGSGTEIPADLAPESISLLMVFDKLKALASWHSPTPLPMVWEPRVLLQDDRVEHPEETTTALYLLSGELYGEASALFQAPVPDKEDPGVAAATAFRVLSSIAELNPRDDQALRLLAYVLMEWGLYREAESVFAAVRRRRPFEPQNILLEGIAQAAQGRLGEAALRFEIVLQRPFPRFGEYVKPVAARLYGDLIRVAALNYPSHPAADFWRTKAEALLGGEWDRMPKGRLMLFWNLDDSDVDLHVRENRYTEVWYQNQASRSGGRLFWDNTVGLGPELYEHPKLSRSGFLVSVDYFSSSSVEGAAPAATFVCAFHSGGDRALPAASWHTTVLLSVEEDLVQIMPLWKR